MASRLLWASRAASCLRISVSHRGFAIVRKDREYLAFHGRTKFDKNFPIVGMTDHAEHYQSDVRKDLEYLAFHGRTKTDKYFPIVGMTDHAQHYQSDVLKDLRYLDSYGRVKADEYSPIVGITAHAKFCQDLKRREYLASLDWVVDGNSATVGITDHTEDDLVLKDLKRLDSHLKDLKYADSHVWVKVDGNSATVGITEVALFFVSDDLYIGCLEVGASVTQGQCFCTVDVLGSESACDFDSPVSGKVIEVNEALISRPELVIESPYEDGWIVKVEMSHSGELNKLMDSDQYKKLCEQKFECGDLDEY